MQQSDPFWFNTLKQIHLRPDFTKEFESKFYDDEDFTFEYVFREYMKPPAQNIYYHMLIKERKLKPDQKEINMIVMNCGLPAFVRTLHGLLFRVLWYL